MINLTNKGWVVFGTRGGGKSWLVKHILDSTPSHLVYDPLNEHAGYRQYIPTDRASTTELSEMIAGMVIPWKPALFVIDEANRYIQPKPTRLPPGVADLNDFARHWGISTGFVARRPTQFHTDIVELAHYLFVFNLNGKNDYAYFEGLYRGFGDAVRALQPHQFAMLREGSELTVHHPIDKPRHPRLT